jgi:hypothetical protein
LLDVGPQILDFLLVLDAGKDHLGTGDFGPWVLDVLGKGLFVPDDAGILVGIGITKAGDAAGMAAVEAVEFRSDQVGRAGTDFVADSAFLERGRPFSTSCADAVPVQASMRAAAAIDIRSIGFSLNEPPADVQRCR